jgi:hypothetical protein
MPHRHKRNQDDRKHEAGEQSNPLDLMFAGLSMPAPLVAIADINTKLMAAFASTERRVGEIRCWPPAGGSQALSGPCGLSDSA